MLPGDGDAAVDLRVEVGAQIGGGGGEGGGDRGGVGELVAAGGGGPGGVPDGAGGHLGGHGHVGAVVLDRLEHGDRAAELLAVAGVGGRGIRALAGHAHGLGGQDRARHVGGHAGGAGEHRDRRTVEADATGPAGGIERGRSLDRHAVGGGVDHGDVVADRYEEHVGLAGAERHRGPGDRAVAHRDVGVRGHGADHAAVGEAGQPAVLHLVGAAGGEHRARDRRRHERARRHRPAQLLDHDDELLQAVPGTAVGLGQVQAEPAHPGQLGPELRQRFLGGLEQGAVGGAGLTLGEEVCDGLGQGAVFFGDGDRHGATVRTAPRPDARRLGASTFTARRRPSG